MTGLAKVMDIKRQGETDEFYTFRGILSAFGNVDLDGDIIEKGAFAKSLRDLRARQKRRRGDKLFPMLLNHDFRKQIGSFTSARETDEGLEVVGRMNKALRPVTEEILPLIEAGDVDSMSVGFITTQREKLQEHRGMRILEAKVLEGSVVNLPANEDALMKGYDMKDFQKHALSSDDLTEGEIDLRELEAMLKAGVAFSGTAAKMVAPLLANLREEGELADPREVDGEGAKALAEKLEGFVKSLRGEN